MIEISLSPYPFRLFFCLDEKEFKKELKELDMDKPYPDFVKTDATTHTFVNMKEGWTRFYICMKLRKKIKSFQVAALIAHEAMHVVQDIWEDIGEKNPGHEAEAYLLQRIVQDCLQEIKRVSRL